MPVTFDCPRGLHGTVRGLHLGNNDFMCPDCYRDAVETFQAISQHVEGGLKTIFDEAGISMGAKAEVPKPTYDVQVAFIEKERRAIGVMIAELAWKCREDLIGTILKTGAFHELEDHDGAVCQLADKLEALLPEDHQFRRMGRDPQVPPTYRLRCPEGCTWSVPELPEFPVKCPRCYSEISLEDLDIKVLGAKPCGVCGTVPNGWNSDTETTYSKEAKMFLCPTCTKEIPWETH